MKKANVTLGWKNGTLNPYNLVIRHHLQCGIWFRIVSFKEDVPARFGAGRMRFPKAWTMVKGWVTSKCLKWRDGLLMDRNLQRVKNPQLCSCRLHHLNLERVGKAAGTLAWWLLRSCTGALVTCLWIWGSPFLAWVVKSLVFRQHEGWLNERCHSSCGQCDGPERGENSAEMLNWVGQPWNFYRKRGRGDVFERAWSYVSVILEAEGL